MEKEISQTTILKLFPDQSEVSALSAGCVTSQLGGKIRHSYQKITLCQCY